jgi:hypothetical protein
MKFVAGRKICFSLTSVSWKIRHTTRQTSISTTESNITDNRKFYIMSLQWLEVTSVFIFNCTNVTLLSESLVTTAWCVVRLLMERRRPCSARYICEGPEKV